MPIPQPEPIGAVAAAAGDPTYFITISVDRGGERVETITMLAMDYKRGWTDSPPGFSRGFELEALPAQPASFIITVPSAQLGQIIQGDK